MTRRLTTILAIAIGTVLCAGIAAWAFFSATANATQQIASSTLGAATSASATATGSTSVTVSVATGPTTPATGYTVRPGGSTTLTACTITGAAGNCPVTGLTPGTAYTFDIYSTLGNWISSTSKSVTATTPKVTTATLPAGTVGTPYSTTLSATGGSGTYTSWAVTSGTLPSWATLNTSTGVITGTPDTAATTSGLAFTVTDSNGATAQSGSLSLVVNKGSQTISFGTIAGKTFDQGPLTLSATASSGLAVAFSSSTTSFCTVSGNTVTFVTPGTCTIKADQAGNSNYNPATQVSQTFTISKGNQSITFAAIGTQTFDQGPLSLSPTASSGLPVTLTSSTTAVCTVSGTTVSFVKPGTCTLNANQAGNTNYNPATQVPQTFTISKGNQSITFAAIGTQTFDQGPLSLSPTASSGLPVTLTSSTTAVCTVSGTTVSFVKPGTCTLNANQAGNTNYNPATQVPQTFTINPGIQSITFGPLANKTLDQGTVAVSATASSGLTVAFTSATTSVCTVSGTTITFVAVGTCTVHADQPGNTNWSAAPTVSQSFTINPGSQTVSFTSTNPSPAGVGTTYTPTATATSGLTATISLDATSNGCSLSGGVVSFTAAGTCRVDANQAGNANWNAAPQAQQAITVVAPSVSIGTISQNGNSGGGTIPGTATGGTSVSITICKGTLTVCSGANLIATGSAPVSNGNWTFDYSGLKNSTQTVIATLGSATATKTWST